MLKFDDWFVDLSRPDAAEKWERLLKAPWVGKMLYAGEAGIIREFRASMHPALKRHPLFSKRTNVRRAKVLYAALNWDPVCNICRTPLPWSGPSLMVPFVDDDERRMDPDLPAYYGLICLGGHTPEERAELIMRLRSEHLPSLEEQGYLRSGDAPAVYSPPPEDDSH